MVQSHQVENRRLDIVNTDRFAGRTEAEFIGAAHGHARTNAAARHEHRVGVDVVVPPDLALLANFAHRRTAKLAAPDDQRSVEQAALLQVANQRCCRLVDFASDCLQRSGQVFVMVPICVIELDEPYATLDKPPGQQAVVRKRRLARLHAVHLERLFALLTEIDQFRTAGLHAVRHLVLRNARLNFGIAGLRQLHLVEISHQIESLALLLDGNSLGIGQVQNRIAGGTQRDSLKLGGEKSAGPERRAATRTARTRLQHHEARQVVSLAADAVGDPGAHAGPARSHRSGIGEQLRRTVIEILRGNATHHRQIVGNRSDVRHQFRKPEAVTAVLLEFSPGGEQLRRLLRKGVHEGEALAFQQRFRGRLAVPFLQFRLVIEQLELARCSGHEEIDDPVDPRRKVARLRRGHRAARQHRGQRHLADANTAIAEQLPPGLPL